MNKTKKLSQTDRRKLGLTVVFAFIAVFYLLPIFIVLINSFKTNAYVNTETFAIPNEKSFVGSYARPWPRGTSPAWARFSAR